MPVFHHVTKASQAYQNMLNRLVDDVGPVWNLVDHTDDYGPYWLLMRSMMPVAESIGDLIYRHDSTSQNLEDLIENELAEVRPIYKGKGALITVLYRHSLMHQDEPRSLYCGNITIDWNVAYMDGRFHLTTSNKDSRRRSCTMQFDLRSFYEDLQEVLKRCIRNGPRKGVVKRYNSWSFLNLNKTVRSQAKKTLLQKQAKDFYSQA